MATETTALLAPAQPKHHFYQYSSEKLWELFGLVQMGFMSLPRSDLELLWELVGYTPPPPSDSFLTSLRRIFLGPETPSKTR